MVRRQAKDSPFELNAPLPLPESAPPPPPTRVRGPVVGLAGASVVIVGAIAAWLLGGSHTQTANAVVNADGSVVAMIAYDSPSLHQVARPSRLLPPATAPTGSGGFTVFNDARWDPCQPIHYVVNGSAPFGAAGSMLTSALDEVSRDTGLKFVYDGDTDEAPASNRDAYQPGRYGDKWAPVLIAWTDPDTVPDLAGDVAGEGGASEARLRSEKALVSGFAYFDSDQVVEFADSAKGRALIRATILHELGHVVGLDHAKDPSSLMYPTQHDDGPTDFSPADLRGLARAGDGPCLHYTAGH